MQENLIKLHSIILDGDLTEAAKLCDELIAAHQQSAEIRAMIHTSTEKAEALSKERIENVIFRMQQEGDIQAMETVKVLHARVQELEEDLQLARQGIGAEAYDMACEEMEAYQIKRAKAGKETGTTLSLVDGMAWVYERLDELEASKVQRVPLSDDEICQVLGIDGSDDWTYTVARAVEAAHGITKGESDGE